MMFCYIPLEAFYEEVKSPFFLDYLNNRVLKVFRRHSITYIFLLPYIPDAIDGHVCCNSKR